MQATGSRQKKMAFPLDALDKNFWEVVKDAGLLTAIGMLVKTWFVDRRKVVEDATHAADVLEFEREKAIRTEVNSQVKESLSFFQAENLRLQSDFENRIKEVKEDARAERERIIDKFEIKEREDDLAYNEIVRQMSQMRETHLYELHQMELRHKDEITALQIRHNNEKNALMQIIDRLEGEIAELKNLPQYGGTERREK